jgi:hypothetical protein
MVTLRSYEVVVVIVQYRNDSGWLETAANDYCRDANGKVSVLGSVLGGEVKDEAGLEQGNG